MTLDITFTQLQQLYIDKIPLSKICKMYGVSKYKLSNYLKTNNWTYDSSLIADIIRRHISEGMTVTNTARHLKTTHTTIRSIMHKFDIQYSEQHLIEFEQERIKRQRRASDAGRLKSLQECENRHKTLFPDIKELHDAGFSVKAISKKLSIAQGTVSKCLSMFDIKPKTKEEYINELQMASMQKWISDNPRSGYDYSLITRDVWIEGSSVPIICKKHGIFNQNKFNHFSNDASCPICAKIGPSKAEREIFKFIQELGIKDAIQSNRTVLSGKELDIYIPSKHLAIEFNGLFWHSSDKDDYENLIKHRYKTDACKSKGITLLHINHNEWTGQRKRIWKSIIKANLGIFDTEELHKNVSISDISDEVARDFLNKNHINGQVSGRHAAIIKNDDILSVISYKIDVLSECIEILRFCTKLNTLFEPGLRMLGSYIREKNPNKRIIMYVNRRFSKDDEYTSSGFQTVAVMDSLHDYVKSGHTLLCGREYSKNKIKQLLGDCYDNCLSEKQNMLNAGYRIMYDSGRLKLEMI